MTEKQLKGCQAMVSWLDKNLPSLRKTDLSQEDIVNSCHAALLRLGHDQISRSTVVDYVKTNYPD